LSFLKHFLLRAALEPALAPETHPRPIPLRSTILQGELFAGYTNSPLTLSINGNDYMRCSPRVEVQVIFILTKEELEQMKNSLLGRN
jgi:hypothetical protein